ncbi:MAG: hypothetical protein ACRDRW_00435 [Pseudonocardiaceae bacterium]
MLFLGLYQFRGRVGDEHGITPRGEQLTLIGHNVPVFHPPDDQPGSDPLGFPP